MRIAGPCCPSAGPKSAQPCHHLPTARACLGLRPFRRWPQYATVQFGVQHICSNLRGQRTQRALGSLLCGKALEVSLSRFAAEIGITNCLANVKSQAATAFGERATCRSAEHDPQG